MNGVPVRIPGEDGVPMDVYFATRLPGPAGEQMREHKNAYYRALARESGCLQRVVLLGEKAGRKNLGVEDLEKILDEQDAALSKQLDAKEEMQEHALAFLRLSLSPNYPGGLADEILAKFTDAQLNSLVKAVEVGEVPGDFFPSRGTPPSESTTSTSGGDASASSSKTASPGAISKAAASPSKTPSSSSKTRSKS